MAEQALKRSMRLFGLPYQFIDSVDPRIETISTTVGRKFAENIILDAPVISIIPGRPKYLAGSSDKNTLTQAMIKAATDDFSVLKAAIDDSSNNSEVFKYYDFERSYTEYMKYVNILCRTCATFLEIQETIDGESCQKYDYRNYNWNEDSAKGHTATERTINAAKAAGTKMVNNILSGITNLTKSNTTVNSSASDTKMVYETTGSDTESSDSITDLLTNYSYVQFYIDPDIQFNENISNQTADSKIKGMLDSGSDLLKEVAFIANSGGIDASQYQEFADASMQALADSIGSVGGSISGAVSRVLSLTSNIAKGENVIMPEIYQSSEYEKSYTFTVHLKTPYGTKFGYFMDICVPLMHLLALGLPKQTTANTYGSPFLVKAYCDGIFTCNLGMVTSVSVTKGLNNSYSTDGLPTEVDVSVTIRDLYSDLSMSPQSEPLLFVNNSSLVEYLATTCGLSLITPRLEDKWNMVVNSLVSSFFDIDNNIFDGISEAVDNLLTDFLGVLK